MHSLALSSVGALRTALCVALLLLTPDLNAQGTAERYTGAVAGVVRDSATGGAPSRTLVCTRYATAPHASTGRCVDVDSTGRYAIDSVPLSTAVELVVQCETVRALGKGLGYGRVTLADSAVARRDWVVSTTGCDKRPLRHVTGIFRGYFTPGFESSGFVPCHQDRWFIRGDSLGAYPYDARMAWAELPAKMYNWDAWPRVGTDGYGNPRYYVRWHGTVTGPGRYGHMGVSVFEIRVDSLIEIRAPDYRDCR